MVARSLGRAAVAGVAVALVSAGSVSALAQSGGGTLSASVQSQIMVRIKQLQDTTKAQQASINELQQQVVSLQQEKVALQQANSEQAEQIADLQGELGELQAGMAAINLESYATVAYVDGVAADLLASLAAIDLSIYATVAYVDEHFAMLSASWASLSALVDEMVACLGFATGPSFEVGEECWGGDGHYATTGATKAQCEADCLSDPQCLGYSWIASGQGNPNSFNCWIINECNVAQVGQGAWESLYLVPYTGLCSAPYVAAGECFGGEGQYAAQGASQAQCEAACTNEPTCAGYSWDPSGAGNSGAYNCWLIETCSASSIQSEGWLTYCTDLSVCTN